MLDNRKIKGVGFIYTVCCVASVVYAKDAPKERPNFVWFMAEDVSKHYLNLYNNGKEGVITPNIEKLAAEGIVFTQLYTLMYQSKNELILYYQLQGNNKTDLFCG